MSEVSTVARFISIVYGLLTTWSTSASISISSGSAENISIKDETDQALVDPKKVNRANFLII